jgi:LysM repeat protein
MAVFICSIALSAAMKATAADSQPKYKYYKSIEIQSGDTLWSIADTYISEEYDSVDSYIAEVKAMNSLASNDITSGHYLVIPYYDLEKK